MKLGVTELAELDILRQNLPGLFTQPGRSMLYVGANRVRPPHHAFTLTLAGWQLHLLEIDATNLKHHGNNGNTDLFETYWLQDVRNIDFPHGLLDAVFWWHGPEHIPQADLPATLSKLEAAAPLVVLGCPHGPSPQDDVYGNEAERHLWDVYPADLQRYGYEVREYDCSIRHLLAWKGTP